MSVESRYRVGMAQYMLQNYDAATAAFAGSLAIVPQDDDMYIADVYWLVLSQLRAGKADEAQKTLQQHYRPDMYVGHHTAYEKAMRVAAGFASMEDMLSELDAEEDDLQFAMTAYGRMARRKRPMPCVKNYLSTTASGSASATLQPIMTRPKKEPDYCLTTIVREVSKAGLPCVFMAFKKFSETGCFR